MGVFASVVLPSVLFLQLPSEIDLHRPRVFMCSGYIVAWVIYIAYLLLLMAQLSRLRSEAAELATDGQFSE